MRIAFVIFASVLLAVPGFGQERSFTVATLNCYWFFSGAEGKDSSDKPRSTIEYSTKAGHLIGLLPREAPLFVGFQEIGGGEDLVALAKSATARYGRKYQTLFAHGKDTSTGQNVGAILDTTVGWGIYGRPSRVSDLERELSKHLVVRLTNAVTAIDICVIHLRRPIGDEGVEKQRNQCRALLRWAMWHLSGDPKANLVIMGDFNEGQQVGSLEDALAVLKMALAELPENPLKMLGQLPFQESVRFRQVKKFSRLADQEMGLHFESAFEPDSPQRMAVKPLDGKDLEADFA